MTMTLLLASRAVALAIIFGSICLLASAPGPVNSGPPILSTSIMTVDTTDDSVSLNNATLSFREAMMLANGELGTASLSDAEKDNINQSGTAPGAAASDSIIFDETVFPPDEISAIFLSQSLPLMNTGMDHVTASGNVPDVGSSNVNIVGDGAGGSPTFACLTITSNNNSVRGLTFTLCSTGIEALGGDSNTIGGTTSSHRNTFYANDVGLRVDLGASDTTVQGNVFFGNDSGLRIVGAGTQNNVVRNNVVGFPVSDFYANNGNETGVEISFGANGNTIGGANLGASAGTDAGNFISNNGVGVLLTGDGTTANLVRGNLIGTDVFGQAAMGNETGVLIEQGASGNTIGGDSASHTNVISGNNVGVRLDDAATIGNAVTANLVGTNLDGSEAVGNDLRGVWISSAPNNFIGGDSPSLRNVISGNGERGIMINSAPATGNVVRGNYVGTDASGASRIANGDDGVHIQNAPGNVVGGPDPDDRNVISGNQGTGVRIFGQNAGSNIVQGNFIGLAADGNTPLGNGFSISSSTGPPPIGNGISLGQDSTSGPDDTLIGGPNPGEGNVVAANAGHGIALVGDGISNTIIQGNLIGTGADGQTPVGNGGSGIVVGSAVTTTIGGATPGMENLIAYNDAPGVAITGPTNGNTIITNNIHSNAGLGIDLGHDGVTDNDSLDGDGGPNNLQNYPVLTSAGESAAPAGPIIGPGPPGTPLTGFLNSVPNTAFRIEFFVSDECDESGFGEGSEYVTTTTRTTDAEGNADVSLSLPQGDATPGRYITATATNLTTSETSEFSNCVQVTGAATPTPTPSPTPGPTTTATPTPTPTATPEPGALTQGDNDCDGDSDAVDALASLQKNAGLNPNQQQGCPELGGAVPAGAAPQLFGDIDCDGDVDAVDALQILRNVAVLPVNAGPGCPAIGDPL